MKIRLILNKGEWQVCFPQAGAASGWSEWEPYSDNNVMYWLKKGMTYEIVA